MATNPANALAGTRKTSGRSRPTTVSRPVKTIKVEQTCHQLNQVFSVTYFLVARNSCFASRMGPILFFLAQASYNRQSKDGFTAIARRYTGIRVFSFKTGFPIRICLGILHDQDITCAPPVYRVGNDLHFVPCRSSFWVLYWPRRCEDPLWHRWAS